MSPNYKTAKKVPVPDSLSRPHSGHFLEKMRTEDHCGPVKHVLGSFERLPTRFQQDLFSSQTFGGCCPFKNDFSRSVFAFVLETHLSFSLSVIISLSPSHFLSSKLSCTLQTISCYISISSLFFSLTLSFFLSVSLVAFSPLQSLFIFLAL